MGSFSAEWLKLREPADYRARAQSVVAPLIEAVAARVRAIGAAATSGSMLGQPAVVDLACGAGSNLRFLARHLPPGLSWQLVDYDEALLAAALRRAPPALRARIAVRRVDLAAQLADLDFAGAALVTASALLDLVSGEWLDALVARCAAARVPVHFALSYDGRIECSPADDDDARVRDLVNRHQLGDKGFGAALGPRAADHLVRALRGAGACVAEAGSDWRLAAADASLQAELLRGWAQAAAEIAPHDAARVSGWLARRLAHVAAGRSTLCVGHVDVSAWWP